MTKTLLPAQLKIKRTSTSPYFKAEFNELEKASLAPFAELIPPDSPLHADVLITNTHAVFKDMNQEELKKLKLLIHPNSGYDNFPSDFVRGLKAPIIIGSPIRSQAVAQYILSSLFHHYSNIPFHQSWNKERKWPRLLVSDLKVTLIGFGHIGKILHAALKDMVKELVVFDPYENYPKLDVAQSDVLILACGANSTSQHIIDEKILSHIKENALIINAARGELIKTSALVSFLKTHPEAFAVLDVFEQEPNDFTLFSGLKNINHTSHIAGVHKNIDQRTIDFEVFIMKHFVELSETLFKEKFANIILQNRLRSDIGLI